MSYLHMVFCCTAMCAVQSHPNPAGKCRVAFQASIQLTRATVRPNNVPTAKDSAAICFFPTMSCRLQKGSCGAATCNQSAVCPDGMHFIRVLSNQRQCLVTFQAMFKLLSTSVKRSTFFGTPSNPKAKVFPDMVQVAASIAVHPPKSWAKHCEVLPSS